MIVRSMVLGIVAARGGMELGAGARGNGRRPDHAPGRVGRQGTGRPRQRTARAARSNFWSAVPGPRRRLKQHLQAWDRSTAASMRLALGSGARGWRHGGGNGPERRTDDRIISWIDHELARLSRPGEPEPSVLLNVRLPRADSPRSSTGGRRRSNGCFAWPGCASCPSPSRCRSTS